MRKIKIIVFIVALIAGLAFAKMFAFSFGFSLPKINVFSKTKGSGNIQIQKETWRILAASKPAAQ